MDIQNIKYMINLFKKKRELESGLKMINQEIKNQQDSCNHVKVFLGYPNENPTSGIYKCLFCEKENIDSTYPLINADTYQQELTRHFSFEVKSEIILESLRSFWVKSMNENPFYTQEQLIDELRKKVHQDFEKKKSPEKVKRIL